MSKPTKVKVGNVTVNKATKETLENAMGKDKFEQFISCYETMTKEMREETKGVEK